MTSVSHATRLTGSCARMRVENRIGNLVGDFVGMSFGDRLRREKMPSLTAHAVRSFCPARAGLHMQNPLCPLETVKSIRFRRAGGSDRRPRAAAPRGRACRSASSTRSAWPSISWIARRSAPRSSRCVANECRSTCGLSVARQAGLARVLLQDLPEADAAERAAARVHEQPRRRAALRAARAARVRWIAARSSRPPARRSARAAPCCPSRRTSGTARRDADRRRGRRRAR